MSSRSQALFGVMGALTAVYPILVWQGLVRLGLHAVGILALAVIVLSLPLRLRAARGAGLQTLVLSGALALLAAASLLLGDHRLLLAMPSLVNAGLLITFGASLRPGKVPMIERFARLTYPALPAERVAHCRQATLAWCIFFALNGALCVWVAAFGSLSTWTVYTGGISYGLVGLMFGAEYTVRKIRFG